MLFFGSLGALMIFRYIDDLSIFAAAGIWSVVVLSTSIYAAKHGDDAWGRLSRLLFWLK